MATITVKVLNSVDKKFNTVILPLSNIYSLNDNLESEAFKNTLYKSLDTKGMLNPILVCSDKVFKDTDITKFERRPVSDIITEDYRCLIGNNRYLYAIERGYTHIEAILVTSFEEVKALHMATKIEPRRM